MLKLLKVVLASSAILLGTIATTTTAFSADVGEIKFLIPGGPGGGWDGTARGTGEALTKAGIVGSATYENMSGGGGGKAIAHIIETKDQGTLMVNSTPIVIRVKYIPYDAGGKAMAGLLSGEIKALATGFGEAVELARQGEVKILCVTSNERNAAMKEVPTCDEAGSKGTQFVNWRGFFAAPGLPDDKKAAYIAALEKMYSTDEWKTVRDRNGWVDIFNADADFVSFLEGQEEQIGGLMRELGFLE